MDDVPPMRPLVIVDGEHNRLTAAMWRDGAWVTEDGQAFEGLDDPDDAPRILVAMETVGRMFDVPDLDVGEPFSSR